MNIKQTGHFVHLDNKKVNFGQYSRDKIKKEIIKNITIKNEYINSNLWK